MKRVGLLILGLFLSLSLVGQEYPVLDFSPNPDTTHLDHTRQIFYLRYNKVKTQDKSVVINQLNASLERFGRWIRVTDLVEATANSTGRLVVQVLENSTTSSRFAVFRCLVDGRPYFVCQHATGVMPAIYTVDGTTYMYPGRRCFVTLSGSEVGVNYTLLRDGVEVSTLPGTGAALSFSVFQVGTYTIRASRDGASRDMKGSLLLNWYPVLRGKITIKEPWGQGLPVDGGSVAFPYVLSGDYPEGDMELEEIAQSCMSGESRRWDPTFKIVFVRHSVNTGEVRVIRGPNCRDNVVQSDFVFDISGNKMISVGQPFGGQLRSFTLSGGGMINNGNSATVVMEGVQPLVEYSLYLNGGLVADKRLSGTRFEGLTAYGHYRVKASYDGREVWMSGEACVWPVVTHYYIGGNGIFGNTNLILSNNNPLIIKSSGSQDNLMYRLTRDGIVVDSLAGTGHALSFEVNEPGVYKLFGGVQDYFEMLRDSVTVTREPGIYYTSTRNYTVEKVYLDATSTGAGARSVNNVTYYDGFRRVLQEVAVQASPGGTADIIVPRVYGVFGQVEREYLPYAREGNQGGYHVSPLVSSNWNILGDTESPYAFTSVEYDGSFANREVKRTGPGAAWHESGKGVTTAYGFNAPGEVRRYRVALDGSLTVDGTYPAGVLRKTVVTDEDCCRVETFTDGQDRALLVVSVDGDKRLETYSVYDTRGLLRHVLSPEASAQMGTAVNETVLQRLAYRYDYDRKGRVVVKRLPGCDPVYLVYDRKDRLVMSQDGKQRAENSRKWSYSLYDGKNRVVETGEVVLLTATTHASLQAAASSSLEYVPGGIRAALQYTLYDNYVSTPNVPVKAFSATSGYATGYHTLVTGLVTSVKTRVLDTDTWLTTTTYYDDRCRVIQTVSDNLQGGLSRVDMKYDFTGNVVKQRESHATGGRTDVLESENEYDDRGRLLSSTVKLNNGSPATVVYTYDAVGWLVKKKHGAVEETLSYNSRGWLTGKESVPFKMKLRYENPAGGADTCWNGNISEWEWQQGTGAVLMYGFSYDGVNRLTGTTQQQKSGSTWSTLTGSYLEKGITYDRNGNIKTLERTANGVPVDNLVYSYTGNQLTGLTESVRTTPAGDIYSPGSAAAGNYVYDRNGNLVKDSRRGLDLSYNVLNLSSEVKSGSSLKARYSYLADGTKLRVRDAGGNGFDYLGSLTYKSGSAGLQLESASFGDGVILSGTSGQDVNYFLTDHLGSVRVIVDGRGKVLERNDYYAFGARHARSDYPQIASNRLKFNGKEEQVTGDLGYLDYGCRMLDKGLGRWFGVDPMSEGYMSFSPYNYCLSNPVNWIDPTGAWVSGPNGGLITRDPGEISNFWSALQYENDHWNGSSSFIDWAWNFALNDTWGNTLYQSDGTLFGYTLSEVQVRGTWARKYVTLSSMERWCAEYGATIGCSNYFDQVERSGYFYGNNSPLSPADRQLLFNRGVIGRKDFLENPVTQVVGGVMTSFIPMGAVGNFGKLFVNGGKAAKVVKGGMSELQLVTKAAQKAEAAIGGSGGVAGTLKHAYAKNLLSRYQSIYGNRGLSLGSNYFNGPAGRGFLDVVNHNTKIIYDFKFGNAFMSNSQYLKYSNSFPGYIIQIIKP